MGLVLLLIAAVPLAINLLAGLTFQSYWKNIAVMILPFLYLLAALLKRSEKKPVATAPTEPIVSAASSEQYHVSPDKKPLDESGAKE
jgi:hypothetical protein